MGFFSDLFGGQGGGDEARRNAIIELQRVEVPNPEQMFVQIEELIQQGIITPEELDTYLLGDTAFEDIEIDPQLLEAQLESLNSLKAIVQAGGLTAIDKAAIRKIQDTIRTTSRGNVLALRQQARERGIGGSDFELVSRQLASQSAANVASREGGEVAARAEQRKLDAIKAQADLSGQLRTQSYGEQANLAKSRDVIESFNVANKQQVARENVGTRNIAQATNLRETQRIADVNVGGANLEKLRRAGLTQQDYQNRLNKALGIAGAYQAEGAAQDKAAQQKAAAEAAGWSSLIQAGATLGSAGIASDIRNKADIKPADKSLDIFIAELEPSSFRYKDEKKYGSGERFGIMAQDAERTEVGKTMVINTPDGLALDKDATLSALLAAVARLGKRVENVEEKR